MDWSHWGLHQSGIQHFLETLVDLFLFQHVFTPTKQHQDQVLFNYFGYGFSDDEHSASSLLSQIHWEKANTSWLNLNIYVML